MASPAPPRQPMQIARPNHTTKPGGILPVQPASSKQATPATVKPAPKNVPARLKVLIRRLPPGLTEAEFTTRMGDDWKVGVRVDWISYIAGKISKDPAKPSRPSRAYLHITKPEHLGLLSEKVRSTTFADAKNSANDSVLLGPPTLEFAPYGRVPVTRPRKDGRQGTIDQDQDFIDFLQELTNPITKPSPVDHSAEKANKTDEKVVTPLIQFLRDKKANKGKEASSAKAAKHGRQESKDSKVPSAPDKKAAKSKENAPEKKTPLNAKVEKAAKDAIKVLNKQAATKTAAASPVPASPAGTTPAASPARPERKRERGNAAAAAKILQRDLGLNGGAPGRRRRDNPPNGAQSPASNALKENANKATSSSGAPGTTPASSSTPTTTTAPTPPTAAKATQPPTGPAANRPQPRPAPTQPKTPVAPVVAPTSTQAFLKHANPSQGVTEPLLQEAFAAFGAVSRVEIDKKKGFAYVDFAEPGSLQKAVAASPVKVAQGQVVVLERKTGASLQNRNAKNMPPNGPARGGSMAMRGGRGRGRGGKPMDAPPVKSSPAPAASTTSTPSAVPAKAVAAENGPPP